MAKLTSVVRDNLGQYHRANEEVIIISKSIRADFDPRQLISVIFPSTGTKGAVFNEEVSE